MARVAGFTLAGLVILLLLACGAGALYLSRTDLKSLVERTASDALGRRVTFSSFSVRWGSPLRIEFSGLAIANASWGSQPDMVRVGKLSALLDVRPLLRGVLRYDRLRIEDATVVLERDEHGVGNWTFGGSAVPGGLGLVPKNRTQFPTLLDFAGNHNLITYRTRSGNVLRIALDHVSITSPSAEMPARLLANGAYNDVPLRLDATTDSFVVMRDASQPFVTRFTLSGPDTDLAFDGRLWDPLDFDGVRGELVVDARSLNDILGVMGARTKSNLPLSIGGVLRRDDDRWRLAAAKGQAQDSDFTGNLALREGRPGAPDDIDFDLTASLLDLDGILASFGGGKTDWERTPLHPEGLSAVNLSAALTAGRLVVARHHLQAVALQGRLARGDVTVKELSFALGGGTISLAGALTGSSDAGKLAVRARLADADVDAIARELGAGDAQIAGRLKGAATIDARGATMGAALAAGTGGAIVMLQDGVIARSLVEQLSTDLRSLFRTKDGQVPISCMLGALTLKNGIGFLSPLRLESRDAIVVGAGKLDLARKRLDLVLQTERDSTSVFALDVPVRVSGPLTDVSAKPMAGGARDGLEPFAEIPAALPPDLRRLANASPCRE